MVDALAGCQPSDSEGFSYLTRFDGAVVVEASAPLPRNGPLVVPCNRYPDHFRVDMPTRVFGYIPRIRLSAGGNVPYGSTR